MTRNRRRPGRPTRLLELEQEAVVPGVRPGQTKREAILERVRGGASPEGAVMEIAGIGRRTYYTWREWGERDDEAGQESEYRQFWHEIERARAAWANRIAVSVTAGVPRSPQIGIAILANAFPEQYPWARDLIRGPLVSEPQPPELRGAGPGRTLVIVSEEHFRAMAESGFMPRQPEQEGDLKALTDGSDPT
jgi:hypothetical protein